MDFEDVIAGEDWPTEAEVPDLGTNVVEPWAIPPFVTEADICAAICREVELVTGEFNGPADALRSNARNLAHMFHRIGLEMGFLAA
jgi:hypothetical protein